MSERASESHLYTSTEKKLPNTCHTLLVSCCCVIFTVFSFFSYNLMYIKEKHWSPIVGNTKCTKIRGKSHMNLSSYTLWQSFFLKMAALPTCLWIYLSIANDVLDLQKNNYPYDVSRLLEKRPNVKTINIYFQNGGR